MSAQTDRLEAIGIYNARGYADAIGPGTPYLEYVAYNPNSRNTAGWRVRRPGYRTAPDYRPTGGQSIADTGTKVFPTYEHRGDRIAALAAAQEWAGTRYGITAWKRTPFGTYMAAEHVATMAKRARQGTEVTP